MIKQLAQRFVKPIIPSTLWDHFRLLNIRFHSKFFKKYWAEHQFGRARLHVYISDPVSREWYDHDSKEPSEISFLRKRGALKKGARVFDLGAHQGVIAALLADAVSPEGMVLAVEALKHNCEVAQKILQKNQIQNVVFLHAAAGSQEGTIAFNENFNGQVDDGQGRLGQTQVKLVSVDSLVSQYGKPDVIFIDVEGFEWEVLKGCQKLLEKDCPSFFIEIHAASELEKFKASSYDILNFLSQKGYQLHYKNEEDSEFFHPIENVLQASKNLNRFFCIATKNFS